jgi:hypothetical protein
MPADSEGPRGKEFEVDREKSTFDILLIPGSHTLHATSASGEGSVTFQVSDLDIENLTIPTTPTFDVAGRISFDGEPNSAAALDGVRLRLVHDPQREELPSEASSYSTPLPNGRFVVSGAAGDYRLNIALPSSLQNAYVKSIRFGNTDVLNGTLHLETKPSVLLEVVLGRTPGAIDGQAPAADLSVVLVPNIRHRTDLFRSELTDSSGRFHFDRVPPGEYKVFSWEEVNDGDWFDPEFMRTNESLGTPIRILQGRTENVRVDVIR